MIYTSYFAKMDQLLRNGITPVAISLSVPDGINVLRYKKLAPTWDILKQYKAVPDWELYTKRYNADILSVLTPVEVENDLRVLTGNADDIAILCYERGQCHRHIVANWLTNAGIPCIEWHL